MTAKTLSAEEIEARRLRKNAYVNEWRKKNRPRWNAYMKQWHAKKAAELAEAKKVLAALETRDVMIRSFPAQAYERAKLAAGARGLGLGEYLARLVDAHEMLGGERLLAFDITGLSEVRR